MIGGGRSSVHGRRLVVGHALPALAAFLLVRGQGMTYDEAAAVHGCSPATIKRDLANAGSALAAAAAELGLA